MATSIPFPITLPPGTVLGRLPLPQSGDAEAIPLLQLFTPATNSIAADVSLNNTATFFDGPTIAQGTVGTWFAVGRVTVRDTAGVGIFQAKLWDGTTVIDSAAITTAAASQDMSMFLAGFITSPAGNIKISVKDSSTTTGVLRFNSSGLSKDSTLTVVRIG